jgi:3-oxoacyl-[acyl-carrier-protein] synthase-3
MAIFSISNVCFAGVSVCVPANTEDNLRSNLIPEKDRNSFVETIGIRFRRVVKNDATAADLCFTAAQKLIQDLKWETEEINLLIFISQTPDYLIPNTSSILQNRLGLSKNCIAFDINLGCSGYVYGLSVAASLLQNIPNGKALLLVGDCSTSVISKNDKSTWPLFSDAGSSTALENKNGNEWHFNLQTDGSNYQDIMIKAGGMKNKINTSSLVEKEIEEGIYRNDLQMKLDGAKIFNFALREVAKNLEELIAKKNISKQNIDFTIFHQANKLMLESVRKKLNFPSNQTPYSLYEFGNSSSASIPLTIATKLRTEMTEKKLNLLLSGFGVGLSWGSVFIQTENCICPPIIEI